MKSITIFLLITGGFLFFLGLVLFFSDKIPWLGNLPGDFHFKREHVDFHFPLMTCILISLFLTILVNILLRLLGK